MATPNVVPVPETEGDEGHGRSTIKFPYLDQDDAVDIAKAVHAVAGNSCERDALAAHLKVSAKGGGFNLRLITAKTFGLVGTEKGTVSLLPLGIRMIDPQQEKAARAESFLSVPLYKAVYDEYKGQMLPGNPALEAAMEKLGVAPKQKDKARQVFQRSATQAGYFAYGQNRLVAPTAKVTGAGISTDDVRPLSGPANGGTPPPPPPDRKRHPFIEGLLDTLPPTEAQKTEWTLQGRQDWLQTAAGIFNLIYKVGSDDKGSVKVTVE